MTSLLLLGDRALRGDPEHDQPASILAGNDSGRSFCVGLHLYLSIFKGPAPLCRAKPSGCSWHCAGPVCAQGDEFAGLLPPVALGSGSGWSLEIRHLKIFVLQWLGQVPAILTLPCLCMLPACCTAERNDRP